MYFQKMQFLGVFRPLLQRSLNNPTDLIVEFGAHLFLTILKNREGMGLNYKDVRKLPLKHGKMQF